MPTFISETITVHPSHKTLSESGMGLVSRGSVFKKVDDTQEDEEIVQDFKLFRNAYLNVPLVKGMVDVKTDQTIQEFYFQGPNEKKLNKFKNDRNLMHFFHRIATLLNIYGNAYGEVVIKNGEQPELKILNPEWIRVIRSKSGDVIGYIQRIEGNDVGVWGTTGDVAKDALMRSDPTKFKGKLESIFHFKLNVLGSDKYGTSMIRPMLPLLQTKMDMEADLSKALKRYISPLIWVKVGNNDLPASETDIQTVSQELQDIHSESELVTSHLVDAQVLGFNGKGMDIKTPFEHVDKQIISAGQVPPFLLGVGNSDRATAEVGLRAFTRHVKSIQRVLKESFEDQIMRFHGLGSDQDELIWVQADERETDMEIDRLRGLTTDGLLTPQKANSLLPPKFHEKLPNPQELATPRSSQGKGADKISQNDTPNDPTKSTLRVPDKRVVRTDKRSPLDDKGLSKDVDGSS